MINYVHYYYERDNQRFTLNVGFRFVKPPGQAPATTSNHLQLKQLKNQPSTTTEIVRVEQTAEE